jgi:nucleoid DNA-binding protein/cell division septation protein DedD
MEMDVGAYIGHLLYEHEAVAIPGLGSFVAQYKPAYVDQVQGELHPPAKDIQFNANLVMDDGLLADYLCRQQGLSLPQAQEAIQGFVTEIKEALQARKIVSFAKLGRLYMDFEKNIQFLPDGVNFNTDSYGLPVLHFYPVLRTAPTGAKKAASPAGVAGAAPKPTAKPPTPSPWRQWLDNSLALVVILATLVIAISAYFLFLHPRGGEVTSQPPPLDRLNVSPGSEAPGPLAEAPADEDDDLLEDEAPLDTEAPTLAPGQRFFIISVGVFGKPENVERMIRRIYDAGYEPYVEEVGSLTRLGIQRAYTSEADLQQTLRDVQKRLSKDAKVIER